MESFSSYVRVNQYAARRVIRALQRASWPVLIISFAPAFYFIYRALKYLTPGVSRSSGNDLLFHLAPSGSPLRSGHYPAPLTAGVVPKRFHSHNDYVQAIPCLKALSYGAGSIEADIWLVNGELYVGHDAKDIQPGRTLNALYLDPLVSIIKSANEHSNSSKLRGVWETAPYLPLHLLIDIKTDGPKTFAKLHSVLAPLRKAGYLTTWTSDKGGGKMKPSVLTVIGTGNTPLASVQALGWTAEMPRDVFLDAVLDLIPDDQEGVYTSDISPLASSDFAHSVGSSWTIPAIGRARIRRLTDAAHARGIQARFWRTPRFPDKARNAVWQMLLDEGVDWLNVDELHKARAF